MKFRYDRDENRLTVLLNSDALADEDFESDGIIVSIDEDGGLVSLVIDNGSHFVERAVAAGIEVEGVPAVQPKKGMVWHDADSSMISAYGYDEDEEILEVAFHRTGVYRYFDVPYEVFKGLHEASSQGNYMRAHIIDMYPYEKSRGRR